MADVISDCEDKLYCHIPEKSIVIDMWRTFNTDKDIQVIPYGNTKT